MAQRTRAYLYARFEAEDFPTQEDFQDLIDSAYNLLEEPGLKGVAPWVLANEYEQDQVVRYGAQLYYALQAVPANTLLTDTAYWAPINMAVGEVLVADINNPVELNDEPSTSGLFLWARQVVAAGPDKLRLYRHDEDGLLEQMPWVVEADNTGVWLAVDREMLEVTVANIDNPTELNAFAGGLTRFIIARQTSGVIADRLTLYAFDTQGSPTLPVQAPYVMAAATSGSWVAVSGYNAISLKANQITTNSLAVTQSAIIPKLMRAFLVDSGNSTPTNADLDVYGQSVHYVALGQNLGTGKVNLSDIAVLDAASGESYLIHNLTGALVTLHTGTAGTFTSTETDERKLRPGEMALVTYIDAITAAALGGAIAQGGWDDFAIAAPSKYVVNLASPGNVEVWHQIIHSSGAGLISGGADDAWDGRELVFTASGLGAYTVTLLTHGGGASSVTAEAIGATTPLRVVYSTAQSDWLRV